MYFSVVVNGIGAAIIWVAEGEYIAKCATESSKGFYFGLFILLYQGSQIFGSFFGGLIFEFKLNKTIFFVIMSSLALAAALSFVILK